MSKNFNSTSPQESAKIIADIEVKTTVAFPKDPGKAFELLDEFYKEHKSDEAITNKITTLRKRFGNMLTEIAKKINAERELALKDAEKTEPNKSQEEKTKEVAASQEEAKNELKKLMTK